MTVRRRVLATILLVIIAFSHSTGQTTTPKGTQPMKRVTGIGGIFFKAHNPDSLRAWYHQHLGIDIEPWGGHAFQWRSDDNPTGGGTTVWNIFKADSKYFEPSKAQFMINYRVEDLDKLLEVLKSEGCTVDPKVEDSEFGKFGWVMDPEGNRIELWQPPHEE
jgi:predicted enzyme related to lactoylglutathione lyase